MEIHFTQNITIIALAVMLTACAASTANTTAVVSGTEKPVSAAAVRVAVTKESQLELQQIVASSLHQLNLKISKSALTQSSTLIIERKTLTGFDLGKPDVFKLFKQQNQCILVNLHSKQRYELITTQCIFAN